MPSRELFIVIVVVALLLPNYINPWKEGKPLLLVLFFFTYFFNLAPRCLVLIWFMIRGRWTELRSALSIPFLMTFIVTVCTFFLISNTNCSNSMCVLEEFIVTIAGEIESEYGTSSVMNKTDESSDEMKL